MKVVPHPLPQWRLKKMISEQVDKVAKLEQLLAERDKQIESLYLQMANSVMIDVFLHEANHTLAAATFHLENLHSLLETFPKELEDQIKAVAHSFKRLIDLFRITMLTVRADRGPLTTQQLASVAEGTLHLIRPLCREEIVFSSRIDLETERVPANCTQFEFQQVLTNLILNSITAVRLTRKKSKSIDVQLFSEGNSLVLIVSDNGTGIPRELRERIFEPGFTTSSDRSGLGLTVVKYIVRKWGGTIRLETRKGRYTKVNVAW